MPYKVFIDGVLLPVTPSKIVTTINSKNETMDLINEGEVSIPKSPGLTDIEFDALLPNSKYPFAMYPNGKYQNAIYYLNKLEKLKKNKSTFQFIVTRRSPNNKQLFDTNITCTLEDYTIEEDAENGMDVLVSIKLKQYKPFKVKTVTVKKKSTAAKKKTTATKKNTRATKKTTTKTYTIKKGDTLWAISKKHLGKATRYPEIYKLNKDVIEKTAKNYGKKSSNNGHWIYPGTKLKLPAK